MINSLPTVQRLQSEAQRYGCPELVALGGAPTHAHMDYLDLMINRGRMPLRPQAVAEFQGRAVLYLLDGGIEEGQSRPTTEKIHNLSQLLANRSEHACLGVISPGQLEVYPINLDRGKLELAQPRLILVSDPNAPFFFHSLASGTLSLDGQHKEPDYVFNEIHGLLTKASEDLMPRMAPLDTLSVTGRALFFRFLIDRRIVLPSELGEICPGTRANDLFDVFSSAEKAAATSHWLDETFNGNLLPLVEYKTNQPDAKARLAAYRTFYKKAGIQTDGLVFQHLKAILCGWQHVGGSAFQPRLEGLRDWDEFNFAHIPIGVLSQVYETFSRQWDESHAKITSVHYTPRKIAQLLVEEALSGIEDPENARVLDPACGAGTFLILAFRALVRKRWEKDQERPNTKTIQRILYEQLCGFDVSESALRLAALSLYITAIEINGTTRPPKSLKAPHALKDHVLFNFGPSDQRLKKDEFVLGSLDPSVPKNFDAQFDVVVGNPPWTRIRNDDIINSEFTKITQRVLGARDLHSLARNYTNPDKNPDLPFLWRAAEWCKPGGAIAMALPARIILKQSNLGRISREALLKGLTITGILNGSDLEKTKVWPHMDLPFMLLWARNKPSDVNHYFHFITPLRENSLCQHGEFRIDYQAAQTISVQSVIEKPWLLKALGVGTILDVDLWDNILLTPSLKELKHTWKSPLFSGKGFSLEPRKEIEADGWLQKLRLFEPTATAALLQEKQQTFKQAFGVQAPYQTCKQNLYEAPLLIIPQSPGERVDSAKSYRSLKRSFCFTQSYYGYSAKGHPEGEVAVSLLHLILHSQLFKHFCLLRSSRIGASYRTFIKEDLDSFPYPELESLKSTQKKHILELANSLDGQKNNVFSKIDDFIYNLYGLDEHDRTVVQDTVKCGAPYRTTRELATRPPDEAQLALFGKSLEGMLNPFFHAGGKTLSVNVIPKNISGSLSQWRFVILSSIKSPIMPSAPLFSMLLQEANRTASSRIFMRLPDNGGLLLGIINQYRFWTRSRARLCGTYISRRHLDAFSHLDS